MLEKATKALTLRDGIGPGLTLGTVLPSFMSQNTSAMHYARCRQGGILSKPVKKGANSVKKLFGWLRT